MLQNGVMKDKRQRKKESWVGILIGAIVILISLKSTIFPAIGSLIGGLIAGFIVGKGIKEGAKAGFLSGFVAVAVLALAGLILNLFSNYPYIWIIEGAIEFELLTIIPEIIGGAIGGSINRRLDDPTVSIAG